MLKGGLNQMLNGVGVLNYILKGGVLNQMINVVMGQVKLHINSHSGLNEMLTRGFQIKW